MSVGVFASHFYHLKHIISHYIYTRHAYDGEAGLYHDEEKDIYFLAAEHKNSFEFNGYDFFRILTTKDIDSALLLINGTNEERWEYLNGWKRYAEYEKLQKRG